MVPLPTVLIVADRTAHCTQLAGPDTRGDHRNRLGRFHVAISTLHAGFAQEIHEPGHELGMRLHVKDVSRDEQLKARVAELEGLLAAANRKLLGPAVVEGEVVG